MTRIILNCLPAKNNLLSVDLQKTCNRSEGEWSISSSVHSFRDPTCNAWKQLVFLSHRFYLGGDKTAAFWCKQEEGARRRVLIRGRDSLRVWAPWCETPTQPWGCTDSLFILGSLRPALAALSLKDKNSCFVSCTDNKGPQIGRGLSLSNFSFSFFFSRNSTVILRISKLTHGTRKRMGTTRGPFSSPLYIHTSEFRIQQLRKTLKFPLLSSVDRVHINSNRQKVFVENESPAAAAGSQQWTTKGTN